MSTNATTAAPTGRKKAIGHRSSAIGNPSRRSETKADALGHDPQNTSAPPRSAAFTPLQCPDADRAGNVVTSPVMTTAKRAEARAPKRGEQLPKLLDELNEVLAA